MKKDVFEYHLPEELIAKFPLAKRDSSRLLVYQKGSIAHQKFTELENYLNAEHLLVFNNTKVVPARLMFQKETGAIIEIFLLHPLQPTTVVGEALLKGSPVVWECAIGNLKRWKTGQPLQTSLQINGHQLVLQASLLDTDRKMVALSWNIPEIAFVDILAQTGEMPLPPYLNRKATPEDKETYQTVYSKKEGAVAAPTAGLHFTEEVLSRLHQKGVSIQELTLHVSAGTFLPVKTEHIEDHKMHQEQMVVSLDNLKALATAKKIVAVGTTSMRTLESLYWYGVMLAKEKKYLPFEVDQKIPYAFAPETLPGRTTAMEIIIERMEERGMQEIVGETSIFLYPGYQFRMCEGLVTNFHQPGSTLIMLIAAFIGDDWQKIYQEAIAEKYRFLSYGDSSLLML